MNLNGDQARTTKTGLLEINFQALGFVVVSFLLVAIALEGVCYLFNLISPRQASHASDLRLEEHRDYRKQPNWSPETATFYEERGDWKAVHYESFIGWRGDERSGKVLNTDHDGSRITINLDRLATTVFDFYGGSTIWGEGVSDANTIPSLFVKCAEGAFARNFGELSYNSRQELNLFLNNVVRGQVGDIIVFYDGVNDVQTECLKAVGPFGDSRTGVIRSVMATVGDDGRIRGSASLIELRNVIASIIPNTAALFEKITGRQLSEDISIHVNLSDYEINICNSHDSADLVAENLVRNWEAASLIAARHNVRFYAVLQPNPYTSNATQPYYDKDYDGLINAVYPIIKKKAFAFKWFVDGSDWLNDRDDLYIDTCCHVNAKGNAIIAERLSKTFLGSDAR